MTKTKKKITYSQVGDNYETKDPIKKLAQTTAAKTGKNLLQHKFIEIPDSRGESAYVWQQGKIYMASVIEGLGTKNLVADEMAISSKKTYYDIVGYDTVATIINDLTTVGARPLVVHAYWAVQDNSWLENTSRMQALILGWKSACDAAGASWGGGETPTLKGIMLPNTAEFGGSAVGIIPTKKNLILDKNLQEKDHIILLRSNGINANGLSLARAIAEKLPKKYATKITSNTTYGEALLTKTNIYAMLLQDLQKNCIDVHYLSNITGHGLRKIMRAKQNFSYIVEKLFEPQDIFCFMQKQAGLSEKEAYATWNMGQDYALFLPEKDVAKTLAISKKHGFEAIDAGSIKKGKKQVVLTAKNITFEGKTLDLR